MGDFFFARRRKGRKIFNKLIQSSQAATEINRNARKVIFSQIAPMIAEKE